MYFWDSIQDYGDRVCFIDRNGTHSYASVVRDADVVASRVGSRSLCCILCSNTISSLIGYIGCLRARTVPILISSTVPESVISQFVSLYHPSFIWSPSDFSHASDPLVTLGTYSLKKTGFSNANIHKELALLLSTSGSTGSSKMVRISYNNIDNNARSIVDYLSINKNDRAITTMPMNYTFGLSIIHTHLMAGASSILSSSSVVSPDFWKTVHDYAPTSISGVPFIFETLEKLGIRKMKIPSLRTMTQAGGRMNPETVKKFGLYCKEMGINFFVMYGQTEATARMSYVPSHLVLEKASSVGIPIPGGKFSIVDGNGCAVQGNYANGELVYEGKNVSLGYASGFEDLVKGDENRGRLITGDIAYRDEDGFYYIVGRKKRFLKVFGHRVGMDELEKKLQEMGIDAAVSGSDDNVVIYTICSCNEREIADKISRNTGINASAFRFVKIPEFPRDDRGKLIYDRLGRDVV